MKSEELIGILAGIAMIMLIFAHIEVYGAERTIIAVTATFLFSVATAVMLGVVKIHRRRMKESEEHDD